MTMPWFLFSFLPRQLAILISSSPSPVACLSEGSWDICEEIVLTKVAQHDLHWNQDTHSRNQA